MSADRMGREGKDVQTASARTNDERTLLITWKLRWYRDEITLPDPKSALRDVANEWEYERQYGIGRLADRQTELDETLTRLQRAGHDRAAIVHGLLMAKLDALRDATQTYVGKWTRRVESPAARLRTRLRADLVEMITWHRELRGASPSLDVKDPDPVDTWVAALELVDHDPLLTFGRRRGRNRRGNPLARTVAEAHARLAALGIHRHDRCLLLEAVGLLPIPRSRQQKSN